MTAKEVIEILGLIPLTEEGGMVRSTYESAERYGDGPLGTAIYYLLSGEGYSHLHRLDADEVYHHYLGDPVDLHYIDGSGRHTHVVLGKDLAAGQVPQAVVPKGTWQGSCLSPGGAWALLGTTMAPGYTDKMYEHADAAALKAAYPALSDVIDSLTGTVKYQ